MLVQHDAMILKLKGTADASLRCLALPLRGLVRVIVNISPSRISFTVTPADTNQKITTKRVELCKVKEVICRTTEQNPGNSIEAYDTEDLCFCRNRHLQNKAPPQQNSILFGSQKKQNFEEGKKKKILGFGRVFWRQRRQKQGAGGRICRGKKLGHQNHHRRERKGSFHKERRLCKRDRCGLSLKPCLLASVFCFLSLLALLLLPSSITMNISINPFKVPI
ncbi:hypothetical protein Ahy_A08g039369 isoform E [Arachis hypogaea]|uniref:Uncharacterized protein n=1 Tax=Arachis hypogaea TaxID=3818 RepID=A0A445BWL1_ARAHY|nr:hypothetical protein Ahy_A08g039369 isoform E [Arachis hypogaea]